MSIQITTAKQKVEFSKMVKDYKIRYYNLGPNVLYIDYVDSTGTKTETVPAYNSFTVISNAGNAINSYLNLYTLSGTTNIVVSKIQQDCAVDGTDLFGNVITAVDLNDVASLLQKTTNMTASSGVTTFTGTVNVASFVSSDSVSIGAGLNVDGIATINDGFVYNDGINTWLLDSTGLSESGSSGELFSIINGNVKCEMLTATSQINIPNVISFTSDADNHLFRILNMSVKSEDADVVKWYLDASDGIKFIPGQGGRGVELDAKGLYIPGYVRLNAGNLLIGGGSTRLQLPTGINFGSLGSSSTYITENGVFNLSQGTLAALIVTTITGSSSVVTQPYLSLNPGECILPSGNPASGVYGYKHWVGTQSEYDGIATKEINTLYYVIQSDNTVNIIKGTE